jgi:hypothetical protein
LLSDGLDGLLLDSVLLPRSLVLIRMRKWGDKLGGLGLVPNLLARLALLLFPLLVLGAHAATCARGTLLGLRSILVVHDAIVGLWYLLAIHDGGIVGSVLEGGELVGIGALARNLDEGARVRLAVFAINRGVFGAVLFVVGRCIGNRVRVGSRLGHAIFGVVGHGGGGGDRGEEEEEGASSGSELHGDGKGRFPLEARGRRVVVCRSLGVALCVVDRRAIGIAMPNQDGTTLPGLGTEALI